jgi:hypothetical protein
MITKPALQKILKGLLHKKEEEGYTQACEFSKKKINLTRRK